MKTFDLNSMGLQEMTAQEMKETDGGIIWFLVIAGALLLGATSCNVEFNTQIGGSHNTISTADSTQNGWTADSTNVSIGMPDLPY